MLVQEQFHSKLRFSKTCLFFYSREFKRVVRILCGQLLIRKLFQERAYIKNFWIYTPLGLRPNLKIHCVFCDCGYILIHTSTSGDHADIPCWISGKDIKLYPGRGLWILFPFLIKSNSLCSVRLEQKLYHTYRNVYSLDIDIGWNCYQGT